MAKTQGLCSSCICLVSLYLLIVAAGTSPDLGRSSFPQGFKFGAHLLIRFQLHHRYKVDQYHRYKVQTKVKSTRRIDSAIIALSVLRENRLGHYALSVLFFEPS
jgi:hypothetical protein